ncbi:hypothetical protein GGQ74_003149 [Desulfobaculum xiamenense]|uniref:Leucine-binding protein domain-containing protein n=1 Tax=Desulfobaculum xiamenense TaxID=995050 RepID=A0A846QQJ7_9BACT|nr:penicillin-binding protein activator [Desulfobaculum xiamenense]NJB69447.1 hypothetical protein [Desulfobaculum xiamenense]
MKNTRDRSAIMNAARLVAALLAIALLTTALGCGKKRLPTTPAPAQGTPSAATLAEDARAAWDSGDFSRSELLYNSLIERGGLAPAQEREALLRLAASAVKNAHEHLALQTLERLNAIAPAMRDAWEWHTVYADALEGLGRRETVRKHLAGLLRDTARPWELRFRAGITLARLQWNEKAYEQAMRTLSGVYDASPDPARVSRGQLERALATELSETQDALVADLALIIPDDARNVFPYTIIRLEKARRLAASEATWPAAWHQFNQLAREGNFADAGLVSRTLAPFLDRREIPGGGVALALPLSGPYAEIGWKILRGAGVAQWHALMNGEQLNIRVINTEAPGWRQQLAELPRDYAVVGGPLRSTTFQTIHANGLTAERPYFAFLSSLGSASEGHDAWRFFSSPQDQVRTLLSLAVDQFGILDLATLHPDDAFGSRLSAIFRTEAEARMAHISATGSYPPAQPTIWGEKVRELLSTPPSGDAALRRANAEADGRHAVPEPPFRAVFLPDGWAQAEQLVPQFFYHDEDRLLFLGSSLWAQGILKDNAIEARYFGLSVLPSAWWPQNESQAAKRLLADLHQDGLGEPDLWTALGYDFIRFAERLGPIRSADPDVVTPAARAAAQSMDWSMAPISWDENGRARQDMFLFRPTRNGLVHVDPEQLAKRMERIRQLHAERVEMLRDKEELEDLQKILEKTPGNAQVASRVRVLLEKLSARDAGRTTGTDSQAQELQ